MWFTPVKEKDNARLIQKVTTISDVVAACRESGSDWLEQLMENVRMHSYSRHALSAGYCLTVSIFQGYPSCQVS